MKNDTKVQHKKNQIFKEACIGSDYIGSCKPSKHNQYQLHPKLAISNIISEIFKDLNFRMKIQFREA